MVKGFWQTCHKTHILRNRYGLKKGPRKPDRFTYRNSNVLTIGKACWPSNLRAVNKYSIMFTHMTSYDIPGRTQSGQIKCLHQSLCLPAISSNCCVNCRKKWGHEVWQLIPTVTTRSCCWLFVQVGKKLKCRTLLLIKLIPSHWYSYVTYQW